jgi:hypothetical protein
MNSSAPETFIYGREYYRVEILSQRSSTITEGFD